MAIFKPKAFSSSFYIGLVTIHKKGSTKFYSIKIFNYLWFFKMWCLNFVTQLRQGQSYCTDTECLEELPGLPRPESSANNFLMMFLMMAVALAMYAMRPRGNQIQDAAKPAQNSQVSPLDLHFLRSDRILHSR